MMTKDGLIFKANSLKQGRLQALTRQQLQAQATQNRERRWVAGKIEEYFHAGTRQVWVVYPVTSKVQVYESPTQVKILQVGDELPGDPLIPGFRLPLSVLFGKETGD